MYWLILFKIEVDFNVDSHHSTVFLSVLCESLWLCFVYLTYVTTINTTSQTCESVSFANFIFLKPVIFVTFFFPCRQILGFYSWGRTTNGIVVTIANDSDANDGNGNGRSASLAQRWLFFHGTAENTVTFFWEWKHTMGKKHSFKID